MNEQIDREFKIVVERTVRPVRASRARKHRMRQDLLQHLQSAFDEEQRQGLDEPQALARTLERFGATDELSTDLQRAVPWNDWLAFRLEALAANRPGESLVHRAARFALLMFATMAVALFVVLPPILLLQGRQREMQQTWFLGVVICLTLALLTFVFTLLAHAMRRAVFLDQQRSLSRAVLVAVASSIVAPVVAFGAYWLLSGDVHLSLDAAITRTAIAMIAAPIGLILFARATADELRTDAEWAALQVG